MDDAELGSEEVNIPRAAREYAWFAVALLIVTALAVIVEHG